MSASGIAYWGNDIGGWQPLPATSHPAHTPLLDGSDARDVIGGFSDYPESSRVGMNMGRLLRRCALMVCENPPKCGPTVSKLKR